MKNHPKIFVDVTVQAANPKITHQPNPYIPEKSSNDHHSKINHQKNPASYKPNIQNPHHQETTTPPSCIPNIQNPKTTTTPKSTKIKYKKQTPKTHQPTSKSTKIILNLPVEIQPTTSKTPQTHQPTPIYYFSS